jgi:hypothetical protein
MITITQTSSYVHGAHKDVAFEVQFYGPEPDAAHVTIYVSKDSKDKPDLAREILDLVLGLQSPPKPVERIEHYGSASGTRGVDDCYTHVYRLS